MLNATESIISCYVGNSNAYSSGIAFVFGKCYKCECFLKLRVVALLANEIREECSVGQSLSHLSCVEEARES